nr:RNA polymerase II transcriptional coactivator KELP [Tanacetum cinerariifolium]
MESTTEYKVRKSASEKLGIDLSEPERKKLVRNVVQTYLEQAKEDEQQQVEEEEESEEDDKKKVGGKEYDDDGDLILCRLDHAIAKGDASTVVKLQSAIKFNGGDYQWS